MKKLLLRISFSIGVILLISLVISAKGQEDRYSNQLRKTILSLDTIKTLINYTQNSVFFYRIWETNPNDRLPAYYYIYTSLKCVEDSNCNNRSKILNTTQYFIEKHCRAFRGSIEFRILESKLYLLQYKYKNDTLAISRCSTLLKKVLKIDKNNIRAQYILSQYYLIKYSYSEYGKQQAGICIRQALENCTKKHKDEFLPLIWGKSDIEEMTSKLNLQAH